jgi:hypothetical protein
LRLLSQQPALNTSTRIKVEDYNWISHAYDKHWMKRVCGINYLHLGHH